MTVMSVKVASHKNSSTTFISRTFLMKMTNFDIFIHLRTLQEGQLNLLSLTLVLLGSGGRLLSFLSTTMKSQHRMKGGSFKCCSQTKYSHLPVVYQQKSASADQEEIFPYPGYWPLHFL